MLPLTIYTVLRVCFVAPPDDRIASVLHIDTNALFIVQYMCDLNTEDQRTAVKFATQSRKSTEKLKRTTISVVELLV